jgi:acetate---CoA ligase (ADP-forming)
MKKEALQKLLYPKSIATVGAGNNPMKMGTMHALSIIKDGFEGSFFPIHPRDVEVLGHKAYKFVNDLPEIPDLVLFVLPAKHLLPIFEDFGKLGTKSAIIITAGFRETGETGRGMEENLKEIANRYGMTFVGPNCMGILNSEINLNTTVIPYTEDSGSLGLVSQSGTYITQSIPYLIKRGIRFSKAISVGNEANSTLADFLEVLGDDEQTKAISLYIEGIRNIDRFLDVARKVTAKKPVIAQYVGGSKAGARSGFSHTGAMAGPDHIYDGLFRQAGIIRVDSIEELYSQGWALATLPPIQGNRIGVVTNSGGPGSAIADTCEGGGFEVPPFSDDLVAQIKPIIPDHAPAGNPVDITFAINIGLLAEELPELVMKSGEVDGVVLHGAMSSGFLNTLRPHIQGMVGSSILDDLIEQARTRDLSNTVSLPFKYKIPMTVSSFFDRDDRYTEAFQDAGIPVYDSPEKAAGAMVTMLRYKEIRERKAYRPPVLPLVNKTAAGIVSDALLAGQQALDEYQSKQLLGAYGILIPEEKLVVGSEAAAAADALGYPVALKACRHDILHKTERGLVHLGCADSAAVQQAVSVIEAEAGRGTPILVSPMVKGRREFLAGITREENIGPCLAFGVGGIMTEALKDMVFRIAPVTSDEALLMMGDIHAGKLLGAYRGMPPVDMENLADILSRLSMIPMIHEEIAEIDVNPLLIADGKPVVVDALVVLKQ